MDGERNEAILVEVLPLLREAAHRHAAVEALEAEGASQVQTGRRDEQKHQVRFNALNDRLIQPEDAGSNQTKEDEELTPSRPPRSPRPTRRPLRSEGPRPEE